MANWKKRLIQGFFRQGWAASPHGRQRFMKRYEQMAKADLVRRLRALENGVSLAEGGPRRDRLRREAHVHPAELEAKKRGGREAQVLLERSRDRYAGLYDSAPVGFVTFDDGGVILEANLTAAGMLGAERARVVGTPFARHVVREDLALFREHLGKLSLPGERAATELRLTRNREAPIPVMMQSVRFYDEQRKRCLCRAAMTEITALKEAERAARESAELNQAILSSLSAHIAVLDKAGNIIAVNEGWSRFAEANAASPRGRVGVGMNYLEVCRKATGVGEPEAHKALEGIRAILRGSRPSFSMEYACHSPTQRRWFQMSVTPLSAAGRGAVISHLDVSQRRMAQEALSEQEARLRALLDTAVEGIITIDERGTIESFNQAAVKLFGYPAREVMGQNVSLLIPSPGGEARDHFVEDDRGGGKRQVLGLGREAWGRRKDGSRFPLELSVGEVRLGARRMFTGIVRDITERKQAEDALRTSEERLRLALQASGIGTFEVDIVTGEEHWNNVEFELLGLKAGDAPAAPETFFRFILPDDVRRVRAEWEEAKQTGEYDTEFRIVRKDGRERWLAGKGRFASAGSPGREGAEHERRGSRFLGVNFDITDRKRDEQRRRLQYEASRLLATSDSLAETLPRLLQAMAESFQWEIGEFWELSAERKGLHMVHAWHGPGRKLAAFVKHSLARSIPMSGSFLGRVLSTDNPRWLPDVAHCPYFLRRRIAAQVGLRSALAFPVRLKQQPLGVVAFLTHRVTEPDEDLLRMLASLGSQIGQFIERKKAEEALHEANEFGKQVLGGAPAGIIVYDRQSRFVVWNPFMERMTGYRAEEVLGRPAWEVFPLLRERRFARMFERALAGEVVEAADTPFDLPEKEKRGWTEARLSPCRDARGQIVGVIAAVRDITDRRRLEAELLESTDREQRRIGQDLHDGLGQQLTGMEMKCFLLLEDLAADDLAARRESLQEQARQMSQALRECITLTRSIARGLAPMVLKTEGLTGALQQLAHGTHVPGKLECRFLCPRPVLLDNAQTAKHLYRIAQEAVTNTLKHARARHLRISLSHDHGLLRLQVKDDGRGLPRMGRPASGMGFEVMRHRAHVIGASLEIDSKPGQGVAITCTLPLKNHEHHETPDNPRG